jgi:hypothetical protein
MKTLRIYESILSDMDDTINSGDMEVDPFRRFDIRNIEIKSNLLRYIAHIDKNKLLKHTENLDLNQWDYLIDSKDFKFMFVDDESKEIILRLSWWICFEILYGKQRVNEYAVGHWIDMSPVLRDNDLTGQNSLSRIYLYKARPSGDWLQYMSIVLPTGSDLIILYRNKNIFDNNEN